MRVVRGPFSDSDGMILLGGGEFLMGDGFAEGFVADGEWPPHVVNLDPYYIEAYAVTNAQFAKFVEDTGYITDAERLGLSFVFQDFVAPEVARQARHVAEAPWWLALSANWREPEGPGSSINTRMDHPVVHVSWFDAQAFCAWSGKRLPTEAEWEYAARGGLAGKRYPWGDELTPARQWLCNIWQGLFPSVNTIDDGFLGTAPARSFAANGHGLYNVAGNVWEWCADWFDPLYYSVSPKANPAGPEQGTSRVIRGGSYLCHESYCNRYRVAARSWNTPHSSTGHMGFRCANDALGPIALSLDS